MEKLYEQNFFYFLIRSWNSFQYFDRCINSVLSQTYKSYKILFVDDASDYTRKQKEHIKRKLKNHVAVFNQTRKYSVYNGYKMINVYAKKKDSITIFLDGDDWFKDKNALSYISNTYEAEKVNFTYGSCLFWNGKNYLKYHSLYSAYLNTVYPELTIKKHLYRFEPFRISHPMTFKTSLFKLVKEKDFKEENGSWLKYELDLAIFLPMLEMTKGNFRMIKKPLYAYNISSPNINIRVNPYEFAREELIIRMKKSYESIT